MVTFERVPQGWRFKIGMPDSESYLCLTHDELLEFLGAGEMAVESVKSKSTHCACPGCIGTSVEAAAAYRDFDSPVVNVPPGMTVDQARLDRIELRLDAMAGRLASLETRVME